MKRVHVVGCCSRCGTTLIAEMMYNCFEIDIYKVKEARLAVPPSRRGEIYLTKNPRDIIIAEYMLNWLQDLYIIYMLRDARDTIVSKHPNDEQKYWSSLSIWKCFTRMGDRLKKHPRFITVKYEDLVTHPDIVQEYIHARLPFLRKKALFSQFHQSARPSESYINALKGLRPVSAASIGNWRKHKARVAGQIKKHGSVSRKLIELGYEKDNAWEQELENVVPDLTPSHETLCMKFIRNKRRTNYWRLFRIKVGQSLPVLIVRERLSKIAANIAGKFANGALSSASKLTLLIPMLQAVMALADQD
ncbi:hypothetical protein [Parafilimonas sp.]|uniref:hypothetical protein n=1 Tax=Parafilimonas sp. TaxID=1969739 RepID=UPI0039E3EC87